MRLIFVCAKPMTGSVAKGRPKDTRQTNLRARIMLMLLASVSSPQVAPRHSPAGRTLALHRQDRVGDVLADLRDSAAVGTGECLVARVGHVLANRGVPGLQLAILRPVDRPDRIDRCLAAE